MKKILILCDIIGTIDRPTSLEQYKKFINQLKRLQLTYEYNELIFSLVSTSNYKEVHEYYQMLSDIESEIIYGNQYFSDGYFKEDDNGIYVVKKNYISKLLMYKEAILEQLQDVNQIIIIDDNMSTPYMRVIEKQTVIDINLSILKPGTEEDSTLNYITTKLESLEGTIYLLEQKIKIR